MLIFENKSLKITALNHCYFKLDGGAMFGMIPKKIWNKFFTSDSDNRIKLASRSLLISTENKNIIIDLGMGNKWTAKQQEIYDLEDLNLDLGALNISDIIITHLHLDHCGSISKYNNQKLELTLPTAIVHLQESNYQNAQNPNIRERGSYLTENISPLANAKLNLLSGKSQLYSLIELNRIDGHTLGQQWVKILADSKNIIAFPGDLIPTSCHLAPHYNMSYDICAKTLLEEKEAFLNEAINESWLVIFQHDPKIIAARIKKSAEGKFELYDKILDS